MKSSVQITRSKVVVPLASGAQEAKNRTSRCRAAESVLGNLGLRWSRGGRRYGNLRQDRDAKQQHQKESKRAPARGCTVRFCDRVLLHVRPMIASVYFEPGPDSTRKPHANTLPSLKRRMSTAPRSLYSGVPGLRPGGFPPALQQSYRCRLARSRPSHPDMNYISPDTLKNDPLDQKILNRARSLAPMAASGQFQDDGSCH